MEVGKIKISVRRWYCVNSSSKAAQDDFVKSLR